MKARFVFACAATGIALMGFGTTGAVAENSNNGFQISPGEVSPGESVELTATCDHPDFTAPAPIESGALVPTDLVGEKGADGVWRMTGTTTVNADVKPGAWSALFQCGTGNVEVAAFTVVAAEEPYAAIGVQDRKITPGQEVRVDASCQDPKFVSSKIESPALTAPDLVRKAGAPANSVLMSMGKVNANAKPGVHPIWFTCADRKVTGEFTVVADGGTPPAKAQVPVKPKGAADTGSLDQPTGDGPTGSLIGAGAAALLAAGGTGLWAHRRRQRV